MAAHPAAASVRDGFPGPGGQVQPGGLVSQLSQPGQPGDTLPGAPNGIVTPQASGSQSATSGSQDTSVSSSNWAGYATTGASGSLTSVSASWTQATANCVAGSQYGAFWVGLDGYASKTVEQIGTEADCTGPNP